MSIVGPLAVIGDVVVSRPLVQLDKPLRPSEGRRKGRDRDGLKDQDRLLGR